MILNNLKSLIVRGGFKNKSLAAHLGVHETQVSQWSSGRPCSDANARRIADYLGVSVQELSGPPAASGNQSHGSRELQLERQIHDANIKTLKDELTKLTNDLQMAHAREFSASVAIRIMGDYLTSRGENAESVFMDLLKFAKQSGMESDVVAVLHNFSCFAMRSPKSEAAAEPAGFSPRVIDGPGAPPPIFATRPQPEAKKKNSPDSNGGKQSKAK